MTSTLEYKLKNGFMLPRTKYMEEFLAIYEDHERGKSPNSNF